MSTAIKQSLTLLYPIFSDQVNSCIIEANSLGLNIFVFETFRTPERQELLYNQKPKVTNARAFMSWHNYGLAIDCAFGGPGKWTWNGPIQKVRDLFQARGLKALNDPRDQLHFEFKHDLSIFNARQIALKNGILAVWSEIENMQKHRG